MSKVLTFDIFSALIVWGFLTQNNAKKTAALKAGGSKMVSRISLLPLYILGIGKVIDNALSTRQRVVAFIAMFAGIFSAFVFSSAIYNGSAGKVAAMWFVLSVAVTLSEITYLAEEKKKRLRGETGNDWLSNTNNLVDCLICYAVLAVILFARGYATPELGFWDWATVLCSIIPAYKWWVADRPQEAYLWTQLIMCFAYIPMYSRLIYATVNTESFGVWLLNLCVAHIGLYLAWLGQNRNAMLYTLRGAMLVTGNIILMTRLEIGCNTLSLDQGLGVVICYSVFAWFWWKFRIVDEITEGLGDAFRPIFDSARSIASFPLGDE
jgi:hypothetical protein